MKPTSRQLIASVQWELANRVAPELQSQWAKSALRSVQQLLAHLAERVECELQLLQEENADLLALYDHITPPVNAWGEDWQSLLARLEPPKPTVAPTTSLDTLTRHNDALRAAIDAIFRRVLAAEGLPADSQNAVVGAIRAYVNRQRDRERPLFDAPFAGDMF
ncbi:MAG: hypothetical protein IT304_02350 [Dehalococcoidia bacterium]|nr:hypothetical protein [Dehalococcoidia bacterium]